MKTAILLLALASSLSSQTAPADDYQISGIVVDHLTNRPLNHILVEITRTGEGGGDASALTGADGRFTFLHVPKGKYNLQAEKRGQPPQGFHSTDGGYATAIVVNGQIKTEDLIFQLRTDSSISGTVLGDDGEPVRNAQVHLFREGVVDGEPQTNQLSNSVTNSSGQFRFGHLDSGKYYIAVHGTPWYNQPGSETVYPVTFYGDTTDGEAARAITLNEGDSADAPITLRAVPGIHVKLPNNSRNIMLSVAGPGGTAVSISPSITATGGGRFGGGRTGVVAMQPASENASTELINLAAGRYHVSSFGSSGEASTVSQVVDLANGSTLSVDAPTSASIVAGRIIFDTPRPAGELQVFMAGARRGNEAEVSADGSFKFEKVAAGKFTFGFNNQLTITSVTAKGARYQHDSLEVPAGAAVEVTMHVQDSQTLAKIEGYVVKGDAAVPGAMVLLLPEDASRTGLIRRDQSDGDGSFTLGSVMPGRYTLVAIDDGHELAYKDEKVIKPYLESGVAITIPLKTSDLLKVPIQTRKAKSEN